MKKYLQRLLILLLFLTATPSVFAASYYVSPQGSDANAGTKATPWATVSHAANTATSGDTVYVLPGDYRSQGEIIVAKSGLTFIAQNTATPAKGGATLDTGNTAVVKEFWVTGNNIMIKGFTVVNTDSGSLPGGGRGIVIYQASNCDIENNLLEYNTWGGLELSGPPFSPNLSQGCTVKDNIFFRNGQWGMEVQGSNHLIEGNDVSYTVQDNPCSGVTDATVSWLDADFVQFHGSGHKFIGNYFHDISYGSPGVTAGTTCSIADLSNVSNDFNHNPHTDCFQTFQSSDGHTAGSNIVFNGNICINNSTDPTDGLAGKFFEDQNANNILLENNVAVVNLISLPKNSSNLQFYNNTFIADPTDQSASGFKFNGSSNIDIRNNIFANQINGAGVFFPGEQSQYTESNNCIFNPYAKETFSPTDVVGNPLFNFTGIMPTPPVNPLLPVSTVDGYYKLKSGSVCIGKGANLSNFGAVGITGAVSGVIAGGNAPIGVTTDLDGNVRPNGPFDIGAYQFTSSGFASLTAPKPTVTPVPTSTPIPTFTPTPTPTPIPGDADGNRVIDEKDFHIWFSNFINYFHQTSVRGGVSVGDFDGNGKIDGVDYTIWLKYYGT